jgi:uncharacterized protein (UPF0216 family)
MSPIEEPVLFKWLKLEISKINEGIAERKSLSQLLREKSPSSTTKAGKEYFFKKEVIESLGEKLPKNLHYRLNLPILFYFDMTVRDNCFLTDETALKAFQLLGDLSHLRRLHDGRLWISRAIVYSFIEKYPTAVQIVMR